MKISASARPGQSRPASQPPAEAAASVEVLVSGQSRPATTPRHAGDLGLSPHLRMEGSGGQDSSILTDINWSQDIQDLSLNTGRVGAFQAAQLDWFGEQRNHRLHFEEQ